MRRSWDDIPVLDDSAEAAALLEVPDNGYELCILWVAGPENARRLRTLPGTDRTTITHVKTRTGERVRFTRPRTPEEDDEVSEIVNSYLAEAHVPPRPNHHRWFLVPPSGMSGFGEVVSLVMQQGGTGESAPHVLRAAEAVFRGLY